MHDHPKPPSTPTLQPDRSARGPLFLMIRAIVVGAALLILVVSAAVGVLTSLLAGGNTALSREVVSVLNQSFGTDSTRLEVGRVSGTLFRGAVLDRPRLIVLTPEGEVTWASARSVRIDYDLFGLIFSRNRSLTAVIDSPLVRLVHDRAGRIVFPRFASHPPHRGTGGVTRVSIAARNGIFSLDWKRVRFIQVQGRGLLTLSPGQSTLALEELSGLPDPAARSRGRVRARGGMSIIGPALRVDPLEVSYGGSRIRARADWDLAKGRATDGLLTLAPLRVGDVSGLIGAARTDGLLHGEVSFSGTPTEGQATACLTGQFQGEPVDTFALTADLTPRLVALSGLRLRVRGAEATGGGAIHIGGPIQGTITFHGINPASIPWCKSPEGMPSGSLAGSARLLVRPGRPRGNLVAAVALEESRLGRILVRQGMVNVATPFDGSAVLDSSWVDVPGGRLTGRARIGRDQTLDAHVVALIEDLGAMDSLIAPMSAESGRGRLTADMTGKLKAPDFIARASLWQGRLTNGVAYDTLYLSAGGRLGEGGTARATFAARGISAGSRALGNAVADVSIGKSIVVERYVQSSGDSTLAFRGTVTLGDREALAVLDSLELTAGMIRFRNVEPVKVTIGDGHVRTLSLPLDTRPGRVDLAFDWDVPGNRIDARGALEGLDVTRIPGAASSGDSLRGTAQGQFRIMGPLSDPNVTLDIYVLHPGWAGVTGDSLTLGLSYSPGTLRIDEARWAAADGRASLSGTVRAPVPLDSWLRGIAKRDESWARHATLDLEAHVDSVDLALLAPADTSLRSLRGTATFVARVSGTGQEPIATVSGSAPRVEYRGVRGAVSGAELAYAGRILRITRFDVDQGGSISSVTGEVPVDLSLFAKDRLLRDQPLHLTIRMTDADFKLATLFAPLFVASSGGRISIMAGVSGTPRTPAVQGSVRLKDAMIRFAGREEVVDRIQLEGSFDQNQLTVTSVIGMQGNKGRITGSGTWQWGGLPASEVVPVEAGPPGKYQFAVKATNFTVSDRATYLLQLTGSFTVTNGRTETGRQMPFITGAATLAKGNLTLDLAAADQEEITLPFYYDVNVEVPGGLFYRTVDSEVELQGTLRLLNKGAGNLALGTMSVRKGRYYLFTREISNLSGDFIFNSLDRTDPEMAVDGETTIPVQGSNPIVAKVSLSGRASRPTVNLWDPHNTYSQADLWKALTFGQVAQSQDLQAPGSASSQSGTDFGRPIQAYLFRNAERWLSQSGWIDTFDLGTGARSADPNQASPLIGVVGAGKYVTRDLYVNYSQELTGQAESRVGAEYRVTRHLLLRGERTQRRAEGSSQAGEEYNLDLKVRLEY